jgi:DnaJ-class molecular chaperone
MSDYYKTLGVQSNASQDEIKRAYKKLAKEHHPDVNSGDGSKFKEISEAHDTLKDTQKRQQYDMQRKFGGNAGQSGFEFNGGVDDIVINMGQGQGFDAMFEQFFGQRHPFRGRQTNRQKYSKPLRNQDIRINLAVSLDDIYNKVEKELIVKTPDGSNKNVKVQIPLTADDGSQIKFNGLGSTAHQELRPGNLYVILSLYPHPNYTKKGYDLYTTVDVDVFDALAGTEIIINHFAGKVKVMVPPLTEPDSIVRLKGKGMQTTAGSFGNLYIKLNYSIPKILTDEQKELISKLKGNK